MVTKCKWRLRRREKVKRAKFIAWGPGEWGLVCRMRAVCWEQHGRISLSVVGR